MVVSRALFIEFLTSAGAASRKFILNSNTNAQSLKLPPNSSCAQHYSASSSVNTPPIHSILDPTMSVLQQLDSIIAFLAPLTTNQDEKEPPKPQEPQVIFHLTGFGKFHGVPDNPTTHLMKELPPVLKKALPVNPLFSPFSLPPNKTYLRTHRKMLRSTHLKSFT